MTTFIFITALTAFLWYDVFKEEPKPKTQDGSEVEMLETQKEIEEAMQ